MVTAWDTIHAMCKCVKTMGGDCETYRDYAEFLKEHHVDTSQFPLPSGYFSFNQFIGDLIDEEICADGTMEDFSNMINMEPRVTNDTVFMDLMKAVDDLGGSCDTVQESVRFLHERNFDFSTVELPEGCKDFSEYEAYLMSIPVPEEISDEALSVILNDPNFRSLDY